jgi:hypothetical protein
LGDWMIPPENQGQDLAGYRSMSVSGAFWRHLEICRR